MEFNKAQNENTCNNNLILLKTEWISSNCQFVRIYVNIVLYYYIRFVYYNFNVKWIYLRIKCLYVIITVEYFIEYVEILVINVLTECKFCI